MSHDTAMGLQEGVQMLLEQVRALKDVVAQYRKGAIKLRTFNVGRLHSMLCNYQPTRDGDTYCNCGVTDILHGLQQDEQLHGKQYAVVGQVLETPAAVLRVGASVEPIVFEAHAGECAYCGGIVKMPRDLATGELQPAACWCLACGQPYEVDVGGDVKKWEAEQWEQKSALELKKNSFPDLPLMFDKD